MGTGCRIFSPLLWLKQADQFQVTHYNVMGFVLYGLIEQGRSPGCIQTDGGEKNLGHKPVSSPTHPFSVLPQRCVLY